MKKFIQNPLSIIYTCTFLFSMTLALTSYINSSFLASFITDSFTGIAYSVASALGIACVILMPRALRKFGLYRVISAAAVTSALLSYTLHQAHAAWAAIFAFIGWLVANSLIAVAFDMLLEDFSDDRTTGHTRGVYLTIINLAWLFSPFISGKLVVHLGYSGIYGITALIMLAVIIIILGTFRQFRDPAYPRDSLRQSLWKVLGNPSLRKVFASNFLLQVFYVIMIIYTPIYLHEHIGFDWERLGVIFTIMLLPFVLFEYALGQLSDRIGEKKIMAIGFVMISIATIFVGISTSTSWIAWALILFGTRTGAACVEIMTESYFFKKISGGDTSLISLFRSLSPLAYIIMPMIASLVVAFASFQWIFIGVGMLVALGILAAVGLVDTE